MGNVQPVPAQDLLENQDEGVLYDVNELDGTVTLLEKPKPAAARKKKPE